ncbi:hypothetical protein HRbin35_00332 [bacterium HR35]|nr:hypothetical protein HRbin35_00332 [bacterium HR35]
MKRSPERRKNIRRQIEQRTNIPEDYKVIIEQIEKLIKDLKESVESLLITCQTLVESLQYLIGLLNRIITRQAREGNIIYKGGSLNPEIFRDDLEGGENLESYLNEVFGIEGGRNITLEDIKKRIEELLGIEEKVDEIIKLINELEEKKQYFQSLDKPQKSHCNQD